MKHIRVMGHNIEAATILMWTMFYLCCVVDAILIAFLPQDSMDGIRVWEEFVREAKSMPRVFVPVGILCIAAPIFGIFLFQIGDILENGKPFISLPLSIIVMMSVAVAYVL